MCFIFSLFFSSLVHTYICILCFFVRSDKIITKYLQRKLDLIEAPELIQPLLDDGERVLSV